MWRFILVTFAFLGWSFYVLSGGADYEPRTHSIQARAKLDDLRPEARPSKGEVAVLTQEGTTSDEDAAVTRALSTLDDLDVVKNTQMQVTLASVAPEQTTAPTFEADDTKVETLTQTPDVTAATVDRTDEAAEEPASVQDLRSVTGSVVNMRDGPSTFHLTIGQLKKGDAVEVLENPGEGWLKIRVVDTGREGWMADWLVTAAAAN